MRAALKQRGTRLTPRRDKMLEVLVTSERHPSASEIHEEVRRFHPRTSLATIYNTIELLKVTGQLQEIEFSGAANRYDGRRSHHHPHLICLHCEKIERLGLGRPQRTIGRPVQFNRLRNHGPPDGLLRRVPGLPVGTHRAALARAAASGRKGVNIPRNATVTSATGSTTDNPCIQRKEEN